MGKPTDADDDAVGDADVCAAATTGPGITRVAATVVRAAAASSGVVRAAAAVCTGAVAAADAVANAAGAVASTANAAAARTAASAVAAKDAAVVRAALALGEGTDIQHRYKLEPLLAELRKMYPGARIRCYPAATYCDVGEALYHSNPHPGWINRVLKTFRATQTYSHFSTIANEFSSPPSIEVASKSITVEVKGQAISGLVLNDKMAKAFERLAMVATTTVALDVIEATSMRTEACYFRSCHYMDEILGNGGVGPVYTPVRTFHLKWMVYSVAEPELIDGISELDEAFQFGDRDHAIDSVTRPTPTEVMVKFSEWASRAAHLWEHQKICRDPKTNLAVFSDHHPSSKWL